MNAVQKLISTYPVLIFSKTYCPYCQMAKKALSAVGAKFHAVELDTIQEGAVMQSALQQLTGRSTVPNVFIGLGFVVVVFLFIILSFYHFTILFYLLHFDFKTNKNCIPFLVVYGFLRISITFRFGCGGLFQIKIKAFKTLVYFTYNNANSLKKIWGGPQTQTFLQAGQLKKIKQTHFPKKETKILSFILPFFKKKDPIKKKWI